MYSGFACFGVESKINNRNFIVAREVLQDRHSGNFGGARRGFHMDQAVYAVGGKQDLFTTASPSIFFPRYN